MLCREFFTVPSDEHIVLNALGGRLSRSWMTCEKSNNDTGGDIDDKFLKALQWVTTLVNPTHRRRPAPRIRSIETLEGDVMDIEPGGRVRVRHRQLEDGKWIADADDAERATSSAESAALARAERTGESVTVETSFGQTFNPTFPFRIEIDSHIAFRSAVKCALEALSVAIANGGFVPDEALDPSRKYVLEGADSLLLDIGYLLEPAHPEVLQALEQSILLLQRDDGSVCFEVSTYGGIVSVAGVLPPIATRLSPWLYRVDPVTGVHSTSHPRIEAPNSVNWNTDPGVDNHQRTMDAIKRVVALWQARGDSANLDRMIREVLDEVWKPGTVLTEEQSWEISGTLAERYVEFMRNTKRLPNDDT